MCIPLTVQCVHFPYGFNVYFSPYGQVCSFPLRSGVYFILSSQCVQPPNHLPCGPVCTFHSGPVSSFPLRRNVYFVLTIQCVLSGESFPLTVQCVLSPYNPECILSPYNPECTFPLRSRVYFPLTIQSVLSPYNPEFTFPLRSSVYFPLTIQCVLSPYGPAGLSTYVQCVLFRYCPVRTFSSSYGPVVPLVNTIRNIDRYQVNGMETAWFLTHQNMLLCVDGY